MQAPKKPVYFILVMTGIVIFLILLMQPLQILFFKGEIPVIFPKGKIAIEQRDLLIFIQALMLLVIIPVYLFTFIFSWKYRADNKKATYDPDLVDHTLAEVFWWGIPLVMVGIIATITWIKTYELDPFKPIESEKKPLKIEVVALQWKWLFLYPEQQIASVNSLVIPKQTPIHFSITADAPMNSFWIPDLAGQIYAMPGMKTELHVIANEGGEFRGSSANISGEGFAGMHFMTKATTDEEFEAWVKAVKETGKPLALKEYQSIAAPTINHPVESFRLQDEKLFDWILMKYMKPATKK